RKVSTRDATRRQRLKYWKAAAAQQAMNERGDKHSFAGLRKPRNAKPDCRIEQMAAEIEKCASCESGLFNELEHHKNSRPPHGLVKIAIRYSEIVLSQRSGLVTALGGPRVPSSKKAVLLRQGRRSNSQDRTVDLSMLRSFRPVLRSRLECPAWCAFDSPHKSGIWRRGGARAAPFPRRLRAGLWQRSADFAPAALPADAPRD